MTAQMHCVKAGPLVDQTLLFNLDGVVQYVCYNTKPSVHGESLALLKLKKKKKKRY